MINVFYSILLLTLIAGCSQQKHSETNVVTSDIYNFWNAYDKITSTKDSTLQYKYLYSLYFQKGTAGLTAIRQARDYTARDYINAINNYPKFWNSIRENTLKANQLSSDLNEGIHRLKVIYPELKPAKIYFTIGALRSNGTTLDSLVLIGSELAMSDSKTCYSEFPEETQEFRRVYFESNPLENLILLFIHEYVHTQQKPLVHNLLSVTIREGVAEFVSVTAMGEPSAVPAVAYGKQNADKVRKRFEHEMFYYNNRPKWLWSDAQNEFGVRDLAYYVGYQMSENYYEKAEDKNAAIKKLIELDYEDENEIEEFVKQTGYFSASLEELYQNFENARPTVNGIRQFENGSQNVSPSIKEITIEFSEPMSTATGVDFGEKGQAAFPKNDLTKRFWSEDKKAWTITVELEPNKQYQMLITNNFRTKNSLPLRAYMVDFKTGERNANTQL